MARRPKKQKIVQQQDQNFDALAQKFSQNIQSTPKGEIRRAVLLREFGQYVLDGLNLAELKVLDLGAGQGQMALELAQMGARVDLVDLSAQMLATARQSFEELGLQGRFIQSSMQDFIRESEMDYDVVICHAVLEWLQDAPASLAQLLAAMKSGTRLSLMFYNHYGLEMHHLLMGNFDHIMSGMQNKKTNTIIPLRAYKPENVEDWIVSGGARVIRQVGVRVIHDFLRDRANAFAQTASTLLQMELQKSSDPVYWRIGRYVHFFCEKV